MRTAEGVQPCAACSACLRCSTFQCAERCVACLHGVKGLTVVPLTCRYGITVLCFEFFASSAMFIHGLTLLRRTVPRDPLTPPAPQSYHIRSAQWFADLDPHSKN